MTGIVYKFSQPFKKYPSSSNGSSGINRPHSPEFIKPDLAPSVRN